MTNIIIKDKGYVSVDESGIPFVNYSTLDLNTDADQKTFLKGDYIVNDGNEINLRTAKMTYQRGINLEDNPVPSLNETSIGKGSGSNPKIVISGKLDRRLNADMTTIKLFDLLCQSNGYKELYYGSNTDDWDDIIERLGYTDAQENTLTHLHIRVRSFQIENTSKSIINFTLNCGVDQRWV